jgi:hypothetical protein
MRGVMKSFLRWCVVLLFVSFGMAVVQWLAAPEGYGASAWAYALKERGHSKAAAVLNTLSNIEILRSASALYETTIAAPRNYLLNAVGALHTQESMYFYASPHGLFSTDWRAVLLFTFGTVAAYLPLVLGIAIVSASGWVTMKRPVLIGAAVYVVAAITYAITSNADGSSKSVRIFAALAFLAVAVAIMWTPLLTRRRRIIAFAVLLCVVSVVGMLSITNGTGPRDALSYPLFFGWTFALALIEGGAFLALVALLLPLFSHGRRQTSTGPSSTP